MFGEVVMYYENSFFKEQDARHTLGCGFQEDVKTGYRFRRQYRAYDIEAWDRVFPAGMYTACTFFSCRNSRLFLS